MKVVHGTLFDSSKFFFGLIVLLLVQLQSLAIPQWKTREIMALGNFDCNPVGPVLGSGER
jgi:hypothetical protein